MKSDTISKNSDKSFCQNGLKCISFITGLFILSVLVILPIIYRDYYFDILRVKYYCYIGSAGVYAILLIVMLLYLKRTDAKKNGGSGKKILPDIWKGEKTGWIFKVPYLALLAFLIIAAISTAFSDYQYEAFWGNEGRFSGLFLLLIYGAVFILVSVFAKLERWYLDAFLMSSVVVCILGILDFVGIDILHFKAQLTPEQYDVFTSTIGNINTYTAMLSLSMGVCCILYATAETWPRIIGYFVCMMITFLAMITGRSDNAYLSSMALFGFAPLYLFRRKGGIHRYVAMLASFFTAVQIVDLICHAMPDSVYEIDGLFNILVQFSGLAYLVAGLWIIVAVMCVMVSQKKNVSNEADKKIWFIWLGILIVAFLMIVFMLIDTNAAGHGERYGALRGYLEFNDSWGTTRGWIWRISMEFYNKFPLSKKLFGYGPDTFGILCVDADLINRVGKSRTVFDNAHNEYLQYLVTIGALGLIAYLTFLISCAVCMIKRASKNPLVMAIFFAVLCYQAQALVNLNVPISAPVMWTLLTLGIAGCKNTENSQMNQEVEAE